jgi:acetylornithine deacetylase
MTGTGPRELELATSNGRRDALVTLTTELASINSVNPTLVETAPGEAEVGDYVKQWMERRGWEVSVEWPTPGRPNIIGIIAGGNGPTLMINAHLDTVGGSGADSHIGVETDRLVGRGVLDTKGGLAAALIAGASLGDDPPPGDIVIAAVCDEEAGSIGTEHLLQSLTADAVIVIEPTDLNAIIGHRGFGVMKLTSHGRSAHTAHREEGHNAIDPVLIVLQDLRQLDADFAKRPPHPTLGSATIQVSCIEGGTELYTVPDKCTVSIELRTVPETDKADIDAVVACVERSRPHCVKLEHEWLVVRDPFQIAPTEPIAAAVMASSHPGRCEFATAPFWTEAALFAERQIPAVVFGPGGGGIHSSTEWVRISDLIACCNTIRQTMLSYGRAIQA